MALRVGWRYAPINISQRIIIVCRREAGGNILNNRVLRKYESVGGNGTARNHGALFVGVGDVNRNRRSHGLRPLAFWRARFKLAEA